MVAQQSLKRKATLENEAGSKVCLVPHVHPIDPILMNRSGDRLFNSPAELEVTAVTSTRGMNHRSATARKP